MTKKIVLTILIFIAFINISFSQDNPFFTKKSDSKTESQIASPRFPGFIGGLLSSINDLQRELNSTLSSLSRKINQEKNISVFFLLMGIALFYGFIHALGPGHGKVIIVSYTLSNPLKARQGILFGIFIAIVHSLSAILLVTILYFVLKSTYSGYSQDPKKIISLISYGLISCMGFFLLVKTMIERIKYKKNRVGSEIKISDNQNRFRNLIGPALIVGFVPCEGAILILIFSITINAYYLGIILTMAMSIGMAVTISIMGVIAIYSKKGAFKLLENQKGKVKIISTVFQLTGAIIILCFGLLLFLSKFNN